MEFPEQRKRAVRLSLVVWTVMAPTSVIFRLAHSSASSLTQSRILVGRSLKRTAKHAPAQQSPSQSRKLLPVDEAAKDPSFKAFRDALIDAVKRKDTQFVLEVVAPDILSDFGGGNGIQNFKTKWRLGNAAESKLWAELETILSMGGSFRVEDGKKSFWAPYVYSAWPDDLDCGEDAQCYAVTGDHVNVRREPNSAAPIVRSL